MIKFIKMPFIITLFIIFNIINLNVYAQQVLPSDSSDNVNSTKPAGDIADSTSNSVGGDFRKRPDWSVSIGAGAFWGPKSAGINQYHTRFAPLITFDYKQTFFFNIENGLGINLYNNNNVAHSFIKKLQFGVALGYRSGRYSSDFDSKLHLNNVPAGANVKLFSSLGSRSVSFSFNFVQELKNKNVELGWRSSVGVNFTKVINRGTIISFGPSFSYASSEYLIAYYGVDKRQSERTDFAVYQPSSGLESVSLRLFVRQPLNRKIAVLSFFNYRMLSDKAKDSPFITEPNQASIGILISYSF